MATLGGIVTLLVYGLAQWQRKGPQVIRLKGDMGTALELFGETGDAFPIGSVGRADRGQMTVVGDILRRAIVERATDAHFEPGEAGLRVRFRVDGVLQEDQNYPFKQGLAIVSCIKVLASIDVAEKRKAQDGAFRARKGKDEYDLRVSTSSSIHGEKVVLRILLKRPEYIDLDTLGIDEKRLGVIRKLVFRPHGMILVTGPTGSGKTTTLYGLMKQLDSTEKNIITVEDPVEYHLPGITQIPVKPKAGITFSGTLESILRQDPDVLVIGEIRDNETAQTALRASLTGHLVLSTLHTNDAPQTIVRLVNMGIEAYLISSSLLGILSQRLVRKLCLQCRENREATKEEQDVFKDVPNFDGTTWHPVGCETCRRTGYLGRTGIFELLPVEDELKAIITDTPSMQEIHRIAAAKGMMKLRQDGLSKAAAGVTSALEVERVIV